MRYSKLGNSGIEVSRVCLGTMTFGKQNTQEEGFEQMDYAIDQGVNFFDTAEMYAVPPNAETYGKTEEIIGHWVKANPAKRAKTVIATKMAGPGLPYIRNGAKMKAEYVEQAIDDSLKRLQTDYIDLYQLHWPNRPHNHFNKHWFGTVDFSGQDYEKEEAEILEMLQTLDKCVKAGKIRFSGLSNESAWGIAKYAELSKKHNLGKMVSVQNEFSLVQSKDWPYVIESCIMEDMAYLPWSPLGSGVLSGKYLEGKRPEGSRWSLNNRHGHFRDQEQVHLATKAYMEIAEKYGMTSSQISLAWCDQFAWVTSTIIGATKMSQLKENMAAFKKPLSGEAAKEVDAVKRKYPIPYA